MIFKIEAKTDDGKPVIATEFACLTVERLIDQLDLFVKALSSSDDSLGFQKIIEAVKKTVAFANKQDYAHHEACDINKSQKICSCGLGQMMTALHNLTEKTANYEN